MPKIDEKITALKAKLQALETEQKTKERAARQVERQRARKAENQHKYELGGLLKLAGLFDYDKGALLGALLTLPPFLAESDRFSEFKRTGDALLARREQERKATERQQSPDASYLQ